MAAVTSGENAVLGKNGDNSGIISFELTLSKHKISTVANEELNGQIFILNGQPSFGNPFLKVVCYASLQWK